MNPSLASLLICLALSGGYLFGFWRGLRADRHIQRQIDRRSGYWYERSRHFFW